jgi:uncharacterized protein YlaN (UPF0358 family)
LDDAKTRLKETARAGKQATQQMADDVVRLGGDFRQLPGVVDDWIGALKSSTPQNLAFSQQIQGITTSFQKGEISASDAADALKGVRQQMQAARPIGEQLAEGFGKAANSIATATGLITSEVVMLKKIFDFGEQGAAIQQTAESFGYLMENVGITTDLLAKLRTASGRTVDDMTLMSSTATLLAGAHGELARRLAESTPELLEIAKAANKLNPTLGDTTYMYQSLALGIKRASPMILDNLGLTIKIGDANQKMANSLRKSVDQLTAEEQKMALLNATLEAGQVLIEQVGGNTDSATDSFQALDASVKNITDELQKQFVPVLSEAASTLELLLTWDERVQEQLVKHEQDIRNLGWSYIGYYREVERAAESVGLMINKQGDLVQAYFDGFTMAERVVQENFILERSVYNAAKSAENADAHFAKLAEQYRYGAEVINTEYKLAVDNLTLAFGPLTEQILYNQLAANMDKDAAYELALQMGLLDGKAYNLLAAMDKLTADYDKNGSGAIEAAEMTAEYRAEVERLQGAINNLQSKTVYVGVEVNWNSLGSDGLEEALGGLEQKRGGPQEGFATGVSNFVVPPGYPNDSFMVGLTSGEVVNVDPAGGTSGRGGVTIEAVHIHNEMDYESFLYRLINDPRLARV